MVPKYRLPLFSRIYCLNSFLLQPIAYEIILYLFPLFLISSMIVTAQVSVVTQHNDLYRTGWNNKETELNHQTVRPGKFGCIGTFLGG